MPAHLCSQISFSWIEKDHKHADQQKHLIRQCKFYMDHVKRIWYLSPMRAAKVQASLRIRAVSPESSLLTHTGTSSESRGTFRQKARSLAPLNGWECAVIICHDGTLEDTNSLDGAHIKSAFSSSIICLIKLSEYYILLFSLFMKSEANTKNV